MNRVPTNPIIISIILYIIEILESFIYDPFSKYTIKILEELCNANLSVNSK